jgi:hypothetical protein
VENRFLSIATEGAHVGPRSALRFAALIVALAAGTAAVALDAPVYSCTVNPVKPRVLVEMRGVIASADVNLVANWIMRNKLHKGHPFIIADKAASLLFAFDGNGGLLAKTPALFGATHSDALTEEQAGKMMDEVLEADKITPAGAFTSEAYDSPSYGESVRFARYANTNLLIHRAPNAQRLQRLQSATAGDNRITYGCINALPEFVDHVLLPYFSGESTVFVLPEMQSARSFFAINDGADALTQTEIMAANESFISNFLGHVGDYMPRNGTLRRDPDKTPGGPGDDPRSPPPVVADLRVDLRKKIA